VFDTSGNFLSAWGEGFFRTAHAIYVDPKDFIWTADCGAHVICKYTQDGQLLMTLGNRDLAGATYYGEVFNMPTGVTVSSRSGNIYVSDGYGNYKIQKFSPEGMWIKSWGKFGTGPGEFALVHGVEVDDEERVYVCDRENGRIQIFDSEGKYITEWGDMRLPGSIHITGNIAYVVEQGETAGAPRIDVFSLDGKLLSRWSNEGEEEKETLWLPHGIDVDSHGDLYVAELDPNSFVEDEHSPKFYPRIGKFQRAR
jgi:streptogramin lyase